MCTTYRAPGEEAGLSELKIDNFRQPVQGLPVEAGNLPGLSCADHRKRRRKA